MKNKLVRITTVPISLDKLLTGQLSFMNEYYNVTAISAEKKYLEEIGVRNGVSTFYVDLTRKITPIKDLRALWKLYKFLKKEKPLIVHTHTPKAGTIGMIAAKLAKIPIRIHTVAGLPLLEISGKKRLLLNWVEKVTYSCSSYVYPNSFGLKEIIVNEKFCKPEKIKVIGSGSSNGINTDYFDPSIYDDSSKESLRRSLQIQNDDFVFIFIGRLVSDKGINELINAFDKVSAKNKNIKLLLVGNEEPQLDPLQPTTKTIIVQNSNIIAVGFQKDVRPYLSISDIMLFPSYREGFPNVVMQAGAMNVPSVVTNINGCNEIIVQDNNGVIIPVKNTEALEQAIIRIIEDDKLVTRMKANARQMIVSRYQQHVIWNYLLKEYEDLEKKLNKQSNVQ